MFESNTLCKVFFTFEVKVDDGKKSRYSATKSAMTIGIISLAFLATVAAYGAPIALAAEAAAIGGAGAAAGVKYFISINLNVINDNWHL